MLKKSQETRMDDWDGHVTTNPYFDSVIRENFNGVKMGICGYMATPVIHSCFLAFFSDPIPCLKILFF